MLNRYLILTRPASAGTRWGGGLGEYLASISVCMCVLIHDPGILLPTLEALRRAEKAGERVG